MRVRVEGGVDSDNVLVCRSTAGGGETERGIDKE